MSIEVERYRWLERMTRFNSASLAVNDDHACNYMTAADWIEEHMDEYRDNTIEEIEAMKSSGIIWHLRIYPDTPVGAYSWHGPTMEGVIKTAMEQMDGPNDA